MKRVAVVAILATILTILIVCFSMINFAPARSTISCYAVAEGGFYSYSLIIGGLKFLTLNDGPLPTPREACQAEINVNGEMTIFLDGHYPVYVNLKR